MGKNANLIAILLIASSLFALNEIRFPGECPELNFTALSENANATINRNGSISFNGTASNRSYTAGHIEGFCFLRLDGPLESGNALAYESLSLEEKGAIDSQCELEKLDNNEIMPCAFCSQGGEWSECPETPLASAASIPLTEDSGNEGADPFDNIAGSPFETMKSYAPQATGRSLAETKGGGNLAPESEPANENIFPEIGLELIVQALAVFLLAGIAAYLLLQQRQVQILDPQTERLLENETRAGIMQELYQADRIPTDLSLKLGKSKATVVEHLALLSGAGLVEKVETPGKKFVFYRLTGKGRQVLLRKAA